jgi:subtilisin family serine protease
VDKPISQNDYFESPTNSNYILELRNAEVDIIGESKWLNAVCIHSKDIAKLNNVDFVAHIETLTPLNVEKQKINEEYSYGWSDIQLEMLNLPAYHRLGFTGKGVKLAIFDAGFYKMDSLPIFDSMWAKNQVIANYDFVRNDTIDYTHDNHGMLVTALAAINYPDSMMGASPNASLILARTEDATSEKHIEELNWVRAMEWADSIGADIIHSSLGYSEFDTLEGDYTYADMDGKTTIITLAAELAASRGIFVTNSAGNQGAREWRHITAPCDGEHVLCVGAVDSFEVIADFSSRGPSSDGRIKPDVAAMGRKAAIPNEFGTMVTSNGTSLSGPLIAGLVACLKQAHPNKSNEQLFKAILMGSDRYETPDNDYGYGIPDALKIDSILRSWPGAGIPTVSRITTKIYPNPAHSVLKVSCEPGSTYQIVAANGAEIVAGKLPNWINFIDVSELAAQYYFIEVGSSNTIERFKFLKVE